VGRAENVGVAFIEVDRLSPTAGAESG